MAQEVINGKVVRRWFTRGKARIPIFEDGSIGIDRYTTQGVEDKEKLKGETREQRQKWNNAFHYGHNREYYENLMKKWKEKWTEAKGYQENAYAEGQYEAWKKNYDETVEKENEFNKLYYGQNEVPDASYMIDYNAKSREGRYANYATVDVTKQDKAIESDIKSLFIYQNEPTMGTLEQEPLKRYYDEYGKENVDRVWGNLDKKYAVIQGTVMETEGLRHNQLVEKDKYSPEAIQYYQNRAEMAWQNYYGDSSKYNAEMAKAKEEFENYDEQVALGKAVINNLKVKQKQYEDNYDTIIHDDGYAESVPKQKVGSNPRQAVKDAFYREDFAESDRIIEEYGLEDEREEFLSGMDQGLKDHYREYQKSKENTEIPTLDEEVRNLVKQNYGEGVDLNDLYDEELDAITKVAQDNIKEMKATKQVSKEDTTEKWSDKDKYEYDLYKRAKENPDSIDPMTENSTDWDALDKKWSNRYDYDKEQEELTKTSKVDSYKERKQPAYKNPDVQREVAKSVAKAFGADSVKVGGETIPTSLKGKADKLGVNITEAPKRTSQKTGLKTEPYKKELDRTVELGLSATSYTAGKDAEILNSISGQLSDGIWENSPGMERYWRNMDFVTENGNIKMATGSRGWYPDYSGYGGYRGGYSNPFSEKDDSQIRTYIADKAKQIVKKNIEDNSSLGKWSRDNTNRVEYMGGHNAEVTVADVYSFYDRVKGRPGKKYKTYGKTSVARKDVDNIKAQVERYKKRKNK